jgi:hypothetical protein
MLLDGYYHLCQAILCTVRIISPLVSVIIIFEKLAEYMFDRFNLHIHLDIHMD